MARRRLFTGQWSWGPRLGAVGSGPAYLPKSAIFHLDPYQTPGTLLPAWAFDGTQSQYLSMVNNTSGSPWCMQGLDATYSKVSMWCWMRVNSAPTNGTPFFGIGHVADTASATFRFELMNTGTNYGIRPRCALNGISTLFPNSTPVTFADSNGTTSPGLGNWFLFAHVYDGSLGTTNAASLYINTTKVTGYGAGNWTNKLQNVFSATNLVMFGNGAGGGSSNPCTIEMQDIGFANSALTDTDISNLYASGRGCTYAQLPSITPFAYYSGTDLNDSSGNGYNLTFNGSGSLGINQYCMGATDTIGAVAMTPFNGATSINLRSRAPTWSRSAFTSGKPGFVFQTQNPSKTYLGTQWLYGLLNQSHLATTGYLAMKVRIDNDLSLTELLMLCLADDQTSGAYGYDCISLITPVQTPNATGGYTPNIRLHNVKSDGTTTVFDANVCNLDNLYGSGFLPAGNSQLATSGTYGLVFGNDGNASSPYVIVVNQKAQVINAVMLSTYGSHWEADFTGAGGQPALNNISVNALCRKATGSWTADVGCSATVGDVIVLGKTASYSDAIQTAAYLARR